MNLTKNPNSPPEPKSKFHLTPASSPNTKPSFNDRSFDSDKNHSKDKICKTKHFLNYSNIKAKKPQFAEDQLENNVQNKPDPKLGLKKASLIDISGDEENVDEEFEVI